MEQRTRRLMTMQKVLLPRDDVDRLYVPKKKKKEEVDLTALKIPLTHQYNDLKTTYKDLEEDWLGPEEVIPTTRGRTDLQ